MSKAPLISIAMPVYNGISYIREAIDSILAQDYTDFELVIADNASTDGTTELARSYAARDERVKVETAPEFMSQVRNTNRAADLCRGKWIQFFCHDDIMVPGCLTCVSAHAGSVSSKVGLIGHGTGLLYSSGWYMEWGNRNRSAAPQVFRGSRQLRAVGTGEAVDAVWTSGPENIRAILLRRCALEVPALTNACVRRSAWEHFGGFQDGCFHFDTFGWFTLMLDWDYLFLRGTFTLTRLHGGQVAVTARKTLKSLEEHAWFWKEFLNGPAKNLTSPSRAWVFRISRVASIAAGPIAMQLLQRNWRGAIRTVAAVPALMVPLLPPFILRTYHAEARRIAILRKHIPLDEIYP